MCILRLFVEPTHLLCRLEESCESFLEEHEWQSLCATIHKKSPPPEKPPSFREAVRMIASLGGVLGRKGDGEPGVKIL